MRRKILMFSLPVLLSMGIGSSVAAQDPLSPLQLAQSSADNTGRNERDQTDTSLTPADQSANAADVELTRRIREAVVADKSLSTNAHNVKIITINGVVTLRGPVGSETEREKVVATARQLAGKTKVDSQLEIAPK